MGPMSAEWALHSPEPAPNERVLFLAYQLSWYVTMNLVDDAALLAFIFS